MCDVDVDAAQVVVSRVTLRICTTASRQQCVGYRQSLTSCHRFRPLAMYAAMHMPQSICCVLIMPHSMPQKYHHRQAEWQQHLVRRIMGYRSYCYDCEYQLIRAECAEWN